MSIDQPRRVRRLQPRDAGVDEARFLAARDHLDRQAERRLRARRGRHCGSSLRAASASRPRAPGCGAKPSSRCAKRARQSRPRCAASSVEHAVRRRARRRGAPFPSGSRCAGSGRAASWPISSRKLFEPMSIAASWPGQRGVAVGQRGALRIHRADCAVRRVTRRRRRGLPRMQSLSTAARSPPCCVPISTASCRALRRRDFVRTAVGSGFAAAVLPVDGARRSRPTPTGLDGRRGDDRSGRRLHDAGLPRACRPAASGLPVVLVVSEIFGVHEHIADVARRFAKHGYLAIAPELFVRQGDAKAYGDIAKLFAERRLEGARRAGDGRPRRRRRLGQGATAATPRRLGVTGFCWGGRHDLALRRAQPGGARPASPGTAG